MTKFKKIALALVALVISSTTISARQVNYHGSFLSGEPFTVKYIGTDGDYLLFQVIVNADDKKNTSFQILDKSESGIYTANIAAGYKVQTLKIEKRNNQELDFKLVVGKEIYSRSFAILSAVSQ